MAGPRSENYLKILREVARRAGIGDPGSNNYKKTIDHPFALNFLFAIV